MFHYEDCFYIDNSSIDVLLNLDPYIVVGTAAGKIQLRNLMNPQKIIAELPDNQLPLACLASHNNFLFIARSTAWIEVWHLDPLRMVAEFRTQAGYPNTMAISSDFTVIGGEGRIEVLESKTKNSLGFLRSLEQKTDLQVEKIFINNHKLYANVYGDLVRVWNLATLKEEFSLAQEPSISTFSLIEGFLLIATDHCVETGDDFCTLNIWNLSPLECIARLGKNEDDFIFDLKVRRSMYSSQPYIVAATSEKIDLWEWETWKHLQTIGDLNTFNCFELINDTLYIGDINGRVQIYKQAIE
ncbi:MAG: hypothetical protein ACFFBQ_20810 [Promethearchaeota archaeon]